MTYVKLTKKSDEGNTRHGRKTDKMVIETVGS